MPHMNAKTNVLPAQPGTGEYTIARDVSTQSTENLTCSPSGEKPVLKEGEKNINPWFGW
jgi:hypothetical protein